jgi:hypothetical protein
VPPRVWFGTVCLLIRNAIDCVSFSVEWDVHHSLCHTCDILCDLSKPNGARGAFDGEFLALPVGPLLGNL